ncbi:hypothetical protein [Candidatus Neptunichlamydia sp. REUL1]|uniref:hypothetical protein n=1 Tax=Candidatus Neptunichlamydia sp. REUL1 TaxID=3064277 RepID=UPI00292F7A35|nr:hypothetical protein [Candidatus Neptunochlamydia sp. REUL1]
MADLNPILSWNQRTLRILVRDSKQQKNFYEALSLTAHAGLIIFGTGALTTFGMTSPSYFSITGSLLIVGYGPACEVSVEALKSLADSAAAKCRKYEAIYRHLDGELEDVPDLLGNRILIAQWHALSPIEVDDFALPEQLLTSEEGSETFARFAKFESGQIENMRRKIFRAYLIYVANNPNDQRKVSDFGEFHNWNAKHLYRNIPYTVFGNILNRTIEREQPATLTQEIFTLG